MGREKTEIIKKKLIEIKEKLKDIEEIESMYLFGSRAKGTELLSSDVDILIISKKYENIKHTQRLDKFYELWDLSVDLEIFCYTPNEIDKLSKRIGFVSQALKEGILI